MSQINHLFSELFGLLYRFSGSYGLAIILLTVIIKTAMLPIPFNQRKTNLKQRAMQPKLDEINQKYANDPERKNQKTMELYKKEKFNPFGGCIWLLLTWPIFIAVFNAIRTVANEQTMQMFLSVQAGQVFTPENFLWVQNIWQPDNIIGQWAQVIPSYESVKGIVAVALSPWLTPENVAALHAVGADGLPLYDTVMAPVLSLNATVNGYLIMPLLSGAVQFVTTKLTSAQQGATQSSGGQPNQQAQTMKTMTLMMPIMFMFFCATSSTVFALYWVLSSFYEMCTQLYFYYVVDKNTTSIFALLKK